MTDAPTRSALGEREHAILKIEAEYPAHSEAKRTVIANGLGIGPVRYYQLLSRLITMPAALAAEPMLVRRLQRVDAARGRGVAGASSRQGV